MDKKFNIPSINNFAQAKILPKLAKLNITNILDAILFLPYRYEDKSHVTNINDLILGNKSIVIGKIIDTKVIQARSKMIFKIILEDKTGILEVVFLNAAQKLQHVLKRAKYLKVWGEIKAGKSIIFSMVHPEFEILPNITNNLCFITPYLTPIYSTTHGLYNKQIEDLIQKVLQHSSAKKLCNEILPDELRKKYNLIHFSKAIKLIHKPSNEENSDNLINRNHFACQRLIFEEIMTNYISLAAKKQQNNIHPNIKISTKLHEKFKKNLAFELTNSQEKVIQKILHDLTIKNNSSRLVQGDVGCGKTVVAAAIIAQILANNLQIGFISPTAVLAKQHFHNLKKLLSNFEHSIALLTSNTPRSIADKKQLKNDIANDKIKLVIGTHALLQNDVQFKNLALIIFDEQHKFGVNQRQAIIEKSEKFHAYQLLLSATPIPRSLAMAIYADLPYSRIDEMPANRKKTVTVTIAQNNRKKVLQRVEAACQNKQQVYWVCTLIDESEAFNCAAVNSIYMELQQSLPQIKIGLLHGKMPEKEKNTVLKKFQNQELQLLLTTTVIEVGVDIKNANIIIIENPERLGLAQLHQLRGRVGRGDEQGYCILLYENNISLTALKRISMLKKYHSGFDLAEYDAKLRGSGELTGTKQSGEWRMIIADLERDQKLVASACQAGREIIKNHTEIIPHLQQRWLKQEFNT